MIADVAWLFGWPLSEMLQLDFEELCKWHKEAMDHFAVQAKLHGAEVRT